MAHAEQFLNERLRWLRSLQSVVVEEIRARRSEQDDGASDGDDENSESNESLDPDDAPDASGLSGPDRDEEPCTPSPRLDSDPSPPPSYHSDSTHNPNASPPVMMDELLPEDPPPFERGSPSPSAEFSTPPESLLDHPALQEIEVGPPISLQMRCIIDNLSADIPTRPYFRRPNGTRIFHPHLPLKNHNLRDYTEDDMLWVYGNSRAEDPFRDIPIPDDQYDQSVDEVADHFLGETEEGSESGSDGDGSHRLPSNFDSGDLQDSEYQIITTGRTTAEPREGDELIIRALWESRGTNNT
ncbi:hypothetical protein B0H11DRAFT_2239106 [Mycena galericulata]|nr:hypothetical protein B0H11DRAFT_2239106 [Mycena galericulata]